MATRKSRTSATQDEPVAEEATTPSDEEVQAAIEAAIEENQAKYAAANAGTRAVSISELYDQFTELVLSHTRGSPRFNQFRTEQSAIRVLELALGWAMQNRRDPIDSIPVQEIEEEGELVGPAPDEIIEASPETTTEEAA